MGDNGSPWRMPDAGVRECSLMTPSITRNKTGPARCAAGRESRGPG